MEKNIILFDFEEKSIRIMLIDEEIWFVAVDICKILEHSNTSQAVKDSCKKDGISTAYTIDNMGRNQQVTILNEANMYRLVMKSKAKNAVSFQDWVVEQVLPTIRKTGKYENSNVALNSMEIMRKQLDYLIEHEKKIQAHEQKLESHELRILDIEAQIKTTNKDYFSLAGYYALQKKAWDLSNKDAQAVGKMLAKASQSNNIPVIKVHDSKYGEVNGYHKDILQSVLNF